MSTDLVRYEGTAGLDLMSLGKVLSSSGYFSDARDAAQAVVKVLAGQELGIGAIASMTGIYLVKGKVTLSANLMAAQVKRSGRYNYRIARLDDTGCEVVFFEGKEEVGRSSFTDADAKAGGLTGNETYRKFPRNMYFARAMSNGVRWFCPDIFAGPVYTPDELGDELPAVSAATPAQPVRPTLPPSPPANTQTGEVEDNRVRFKGAVTAVEQRFNTKGELALKLTIGEQEHLLLKAPAEMVHLEQGDVVMGESEWRTVRGKATLIVLSLDGERDADGDTPWQARAAQESAVEEDGASFEPVEEPAL